MGNMMARLREVRFIDVLRTCLITLIGGWVVALAFGLLIVRLQYNALAGSQMYNSVPNLFLGPTTDEGFAQTLLPATLFAPEHIAAGANVRLASLLGQGLGLILPQVGVIAGLLVWQVMRTAKRTSQPYLYAAVCGIIVGLIECGITGIVLMVPIILTGTLFVLIFGASLFGAWSASGPSSDTASAS